MQKNQKTILISALGKNDPYSKFKEDESAKAGPTLSLILNYIPDHLILLVSKDIEETNRLRILSDVVKDFYCKKELNQPLIEVIKLENDKEVYEYEDSLKKIILELIPILRRYDFKDKYIFSKTAGTPQLKTALEIFPNLFMRNYDFSVVTKDNNTKPKMHKLEIGKIPSEEILNSICDEDLNIKEEIKKTIEPHQELAAAKVFNQLESFRAFIRAYEYRSAQYLLEELFPYLKNKKHKNHTWLDEIFKIEDIKSIYGLIKIAANFLAFTLPAPTATNYDNYIKLIPSLKVFYEEYRLEESAALSELARRNFEIFREKGLIKEMSLSFCILLERLRKNSVINVISYLEIENKEIPCRFTENESIEQNSFSEKFIEYYNNYFSLKNEDFIEKPKAENDPIKPPSSLTMPVLEILSSFLCEKENKHNDSNRFYSLIKSEPKYSSAYKCIKSLRDKLAHDFVRIKEKDIKNIETQYDEVVNKIWSFEDKKNIYEDINKFILDAMFSIKQ